MTRAKSLTILVLLLFVVVAVWWWRGRRPRAGFDPEAAAKTRFEEARAEGTDLSRGPCLGFMGPGWVADVVHDPRRPVDDDPVNQCAEYREGRASHFVELTPEGKVIRVH